jgi:hypothetical protein
MKVLAMAALLVALLSSAAVGLEVTSGTIGTDLLSLFDIGARLQGDNFRISAFQQDAFDAFFFA